MDNLSSVCIGLLLLISAQLEKGNSQCSVAESSSRCQFFFQIILTIIWIDVGPIFSNSNLPHPVAVCSEPSLLSHQEARSIPTAVARVLVLTWAVQQITTNCSLKKTPHIYCLRVSLCQQSSAFQPVLCSGSHKLKSKHGQLPFSRCSTKERFISKPPWTVGRIHFLLVVELKSPLSCQLLSRDHSQLLEVMLRSWHVPPSQQWRTSLSLNLSQAFNLSDFPFYYQTTLLLKGSLIRPGPPE